MTDLPGIVITGASGRMGQMLIRTVCDSAKARLVGAIERPGHAWVGQDVGVAMGGAALGVTVSDDPLEAFAKAQAVIDFTAPAATVEFAGLAAQARAVHVIGTTGLEKDDLARIAAAARHAVIVRAGNMSLGVNLLVQLTRKVAAALDEDYDIEVIEAHHRHKVDAPSGTALKMGEVIAEAQGTKLADRAVYERFGHTGAREDNTIGFATVRGGDIIGDHTVLFAGTGERIEISHKSSSRAGYAQGSLRAARFLAGKATGQYDMNDVLGL